MRRGLVAVAVVVVLLVVLLYTRCSRSQTSTPGKRLASASGGEVVMRAHAVAKLVRASIAGTVVDADGRGVAGAWVCARGTSPRLDPELLREPVCAVTDARGAYRIAELFPARYAVSASAPSYRPASHDAIALGEGETKRVDLVMRGGGVEVTGVVGDLTGGPIANARVSAGGAITETRSDGRFSLWVAPETTTIEASAAGYARARRTVKPPATVHLHLLPEATLGGMVVEARTGAPVEAARVTIAGAWEQRVTLTDEHGAFRLAGLAPDQYTVVARTERGYGLAPGSRRLASGAMVDDIRIELQPAVRVEGTVVVGGTRQPCEQPKVHAHDAARARWLELERLESGRVVALGALPGTYEVTVECAGFLSRSKYPPLVVGNEDVSATWEVDVGATIKGRVHTTSGAPVAGIRVHTGAPELGAVAHTDAAGRFELRGVPSGTVTLFAEWQRNPETLEIAANATVERDIVLADLGEVHGVVVRTDGSAVRGAYVRASLPTSETATTDDAGRFVLRAPVGRSTLVATRAFVGGEARSAPVDVRADAPVQAKIVFADDVGAIRGTVVDHAGKAVSDAMLLVTRQSFADAVMCRELVRRATAAVPIASDGTFTLSDLPATDTYRLCVARVGDTATAIAEHVKVGSDLRLELAAGASIAGVVVDAAGAPDDFEVVVYAENNLVGNDRFYRTRGAFRVDDLPAGKLTVTAGAHGREARADIELAAGQALSLRLELRPLSTITGRVIDHHTRKPIAGVYMIAQSMTGTSFSPSVTPKNTTDANGRFVVEGVPPGEITVLGESSELSFVAVRVHVNGSAPIELGDITAVRPRIARGERAGISGMRLDENEKPPRLVVADVAANGPAARAGIRVGDAITSIDGYDTTGDNAHNWQALVRAPPGTRITIVLARGDTVELVLAPP